MKTQHEDANRGRVAWASILFLFWFLVVGAPAAFCAAVPVDVLWAGLFDNSGQPLEGGKVYFYSAGTTTSKAVYIDSAKVTPAANPVILDAYGRSAVYADGNYKIVVKTADDVTLVTVDNLEYLSSSNPTTQSVTNFNAINATIASATISQGTMANLIISSATITLANLVSPNIANASMTGSIYNVTSSNGTFTNGTFTNPIITGGTITPATFTIPAGSVIATPTSATGCANKGYVDSILGSVSNVYLFKADPYNATGAATLFTQTLAPRVDEAPVNGFSFALGNSSTATKTYIITGTFAVGMVSTGTTELITMDLRDDLGQSYSTICAQIVNNVEDVMGFTTHYVQCHVVAYVQLSPSESRFFYLYQQPTSQTTTYKVYGKSGLPDAYRIVGF